VLQEGDLGTGDAITLLARHPAAMTVSDIVRLYAVDKRDIDGLRRAAALTALPEGWRNYFHQQVEKLTAGTIL
jgi:MOSC domain-containing protein YiiM